MEVEDPKSNKKLFTSRLKTVKENWLGGKTKSTRGFEFDAYPIAKYTIENDTPAFCVDDFMIASFEAFKEKVDRYVAYKAKPKRGFEYRYIYSYDIHLKKVVYHQLHIIQEYTKDSYEIEMIPYEFFTNIGVENSIGTLSIDREYIYINVKNSFRVINIYFVLNRGYVHNDKVDGISLGISYNSGLPIGRKALLTKDILSKQEEEDFYLNVNETNFIDAENIFNNLYGGRKTNYIQNLSNKFTAIKEYMTKSRKVLENDIYLTLFYKTFSTFNRIMKKVVTQDNFYLYNKREAITFFLETTMLKKNHLCTIVYPLFERDAYLFDPNETHCKHFLDWNIELAKNGLNLKRIFVIDDTSTLTDYAMESIERLIDSGIDIKLALISSIDLSTLSSYDFVFNNEHNVALYKNIRDKTHTYHVTKNFYKLQDILNDYQKLDEISISFDEFKNKSLINDTNNENYDEVLKPLIGTWYYYAYDTYSSLQGVSKVRSSLITIELNNRVKEIVNDKIIGEGYINSENEHQIFIHLSGIKSKRLSLIIIDKSDMVHPIIRGIATGKYFGTNHNVAEVTLLSKFKLTDDDVKDTFGDAQKTIFIEDKKLTERIHDLYANKFREDSITNLI
ncbi:MAG: hypothetical protein U9N49_09180 [Campylobacterota bacterium]|nr:hypothetical protein [Campylobacterota bacterium]